MEKRIFYDVDTQSDFMDEDGALYVPDAELIKVNLWKLTEHAKLTNTPIVGSRDRHFGTEEYKHLETELARWTKDGFPDHCMDGTEGQEEIFETNLLTRYKSYIPNSPCKKTQQIGMELMELDYWGIFNLDHPVYFEKQSFDIFTNGLFEIFLEKAGVEEAVVYGVATDYCVKAAVIGMQERGIQCYVVEDAIKGVDPETTKSALEEMIKSGAKFVKTGEVLKSGI